MNTHINKNHFNTKNTEIFSRKYLGVTITSKNYNQILKEEGRNGINFHAKHLKAYLQGKKIFPHGYKRNKDGSKTLQFHKVKQRLWKLKTK